MPKEFITNRPPLTAAADDFVFKQWFEQMWQMGKGNLYVAASQTASFTPDQENYLYPIDVSGGGITVTLPPALDCMGKMYGFIKSPASANVVTLSTSGSDTVFPALAAIPAGSLTVLISDGISTWYQMAAPSSGGGSSSPLTTKGDVWTYSTTDARLAVGANNKIFVADSAAATGNKWDLTGRQSIVQTINTASGAYVIDMGSYNAVIVNMVGPVTLTFSGGTDFQICRIRAVQDATGGRSLTFGAGCAFGSDITNFTSNPTANATDLVAVQYNAVAGTYQVVAFTRGY